mmetsp:Transcript_18682/g.52244  ORF Transcript_18682/g.52244 Transcript_18682/m.52244 type:complete len:280 (-) Transcript_18682:1250-2089(-)
MHGQEDPRRLFSIDRCQLVFEPLVLGRSGRHVRIGIDNDVPSRSVGKCVVRVSPLVGQGVGRSVHVHRSVLAVAIEHTEFRRLDTGHAETVLVSEENLVSGVLLVNVVISRGNHQGNLVEVALIVQKVKKGVPFPSVVVWVGNIAHQNHGSDSLGMVPDVVQHLLGVLELSNVPNDPKRHGIESARRPAIGATLTLTLTVIAISIAIAIRFLRRRPKASNLPRIDASDSGGIVGGRTQAPPVRVPQGCRWVDLDDFRVGIVISSQICLVVLVVLLRRTP